MIDTVIFEKFLFHRCGTRKELIKFEISYLFDQKTMTVNY